MDYRWTESTKPRISSNPTAGKRHLLDLETGQPHARNTLSRHLAVASQDLGCAHRADAQSQQPLCFGKEAYRLYHSQHKSFSSWEEIVLIGRIPTQPSEKSREKQVLWSFPGQIAYSEGAKHPIRE